LVAIMQGVLRILLMMGMTAISSSCASSRVYPIPLAQAEAALYESLLLDRDQVRTNPVMAQAVAEGDLATPMSIGRFLPMLHSAKTGEYAASSA